MCMCTSVIACENMGSCSCLCIHLRIRSVFVCLCVFLAESVTEMDEAELAPQGTCVPFASVTPDLNEASSSGHTLPLNDNRCLPATYVHTGGLLICKVAGHMYSLREVNQQ